MPIDPASLITDEDIEMSDWELQDFAVQVVRQCIEEDGFELMSWQSNPEVNPSIWFTGHNGPEWVMVRAVRYPLENAEIPHFVNEVEESCKTTGKTGHFASVGVVCIGSMMEGDDRILRGHGLIPNYKGLQKLDFPYRLK